MVALVLFWAADFLYQSSSIFHQRTYIAAKLSTPPSTSISFCIFHIIAVDISRALQHPS
jgi:hypothetical protein